MLPLNNIDSENIEIVKDPSFTYRLDFEKSRVRKYVDNIESVEQAIYKILNTERYLYPAYDWNYGIELNDLFGQPKSLAKAVLPERIKEALLIDDRVEDVIDFVFEDISKTELVVTFSAKLYDYEQMLLITWGLRGVKFGV